MADSSVDVTAGSGTSIDTRTEATNGNHRQVVVLGDPSTNAGVAPVDAAAGLKVDLGSDNDVVVTAAATSIGKAEDAASADADVGVPAMAVRKATPADTSGTDGDYEMLQMDNGRLWVSATIDAALPAGTNAIGKLAANDGVDIGDVGVDGLVAHDSADSGNPVKIGAKATASIEGLTQVAESDRTDVRADLNGVLITRPHTTLEEIITERVSDTGGSSTAFTNFAAGGAGIHNYVTTIVIHNSSATDGYVDFRDGTAGSVIMTVPVPAGGGAVVNLPVPLKGAANTALAYDVSAALSTVYITVVGFQAQG